ncbi:MAG: hypothetical protein IPN34_17145 [Planctomycetes bacterium]|nr:hypothetical protein [Planctomycetota bacterium]
MMRTLLFLAVLTTAAPFPLFSQQREARGYVGTILNPLTVSDTGLLELGLASFQTGVTVPGGADVFGDIQADELEIVIVGRDSNGIGRVEHWIVSQGLTFTLQSSHQDPASDYADVAFNEAANEIYLLDASLSVIWRNSWDGNSALPTTGWQVWASPLDLPELVNSADMIVEIDETTGANKLFLGRYDEGLSGIGAYALVSGTPGQLTVNRYNQTADIACDNLAVSIGASEGDTTLMVTGPSSTVVEVFDLESHVVLGQATIPTASDQVVVSLSSALEIGRWYTTNKFGSVPEPEWGFRCMRRYGFSETFSDGTSLHAIPEPVDPVVGNLDFKVFLPVRSSSPPSQSVELLGLMSIAFRDSAGMDPVIPFGNNMLLITSIFLPIVGSVEQTGEGGVHSEIPIPNDPYLADVVTLVQFLMNDNAVVRVSEIVGFQILPAGTSSFASGGGSRLQSAGGGGRNSQQAACRDWVNGTSSILRRTDLIQTVISRRGP